MDVQEKKQSKEMLGNIGQYLSWMLIICILFIFCLINYLLFYNQSISALTGSELYTSDMLYYMYKAAGIEVPYQFPYPIFFRAIRFFMLFTKIENATAIALTVFNTMSLLVLAGFLKQEMEKRSMSAAILISCALHMVSMCYLPGLRQVAGLSYRYIGVFTPNPWQNATYIATRPFAIAAFFLFVRIYRKRKELDSLKDYSLFGVFMLLTTMTKPSFTLPMLVVCGGMFVWMLFVEHILDKKKILLWIGSLLPTLLHMLYQYKGVFGQDTAETEKGIGLGWFVSWKTVCGNIPVAVLFGIFCPIVVFAVYRKGDALWNMAWILYAAAFFMFAFLYEKGGRSRDLNFAWGYMQAQFFLICAAASRIFAPKADGEKMMLRIPGILAFFCHLLCGGYYFIYIYVGGNFGAF